MEYKVEDERLFRRFELTFRSCLTIVTGDMRKLTRSQKELHDRGLVRSRAAP